MTFLSRLTFGILLAATTSPIGCSGSSSSTTPGTGGTGGGGTGGDWRRRTAAAAAGGGTGGAGRPSWRRALQRGEQLHHDRTTIAFGGTRRLRLPPEVPEGHRRRDRDVQRRVRQAPAGPVGDARGRRPATRSSNMSNGTTASFTFPTRRLLRVPVHVPRLGRRHVHDRRHLGEVAVGRLSRS